MSWTIDHPRRIGDQIIAAVTKQWIVVETAGPAIIGTAQKQPLVILHLQNGVVTATDVAGHVYDADEIERRYPGAILRLQSLMGEYG
ncbi:hypothetical protein KX928_03370 [Roseobacter sp. YSTF-M11]|uniref:Uncharacterized protein n=1 Tax=Roseobacter insulae TaxID=2859783 RepID=A0A9X1FS83_9RHOB|nr:hypothetical protein [Roseobacter insulae]MBW4706821.1 hypothetical protein [Roseobacter insulae]